jgi:hypothetical protein
LTRVLGRDDFTHQDDVLDREQHTPEVGTSHRGEVGDEQSPAGQTDVQPEGRFEVRRAASLGAAKQEPIRCWWRQSPSGFTTYDPSASSTRCEWSSGKAKTSSSVHGPW